MRYIQILIRAYILILLIVLSCKKSSLEPVYEKPVVIYFEEVSMECMDKVSNCGSFQVVVNTQEEYDQLYKDRFTTPLENYWNKHYYSVLSSMKVRYPGLTQAEYDDLVREVFYSTLPFKGTDSCNHPVIDFSIYTLLGQDAHAGGCSAPNYVVSVTKDDRNKEILFHIRIEEHGSCLMAICSNKWILIPKMSESYTVKFEREVVKQPE
jgi:hypothetical protein